MGWRDSIYKDYGYFFYESAGGYSDERTDEFGRYFGWAQLITRLAKETNVTFEAAAEYRIGYSLYMWTMFKKEAALTEYVAKQTQHLKR